MHEGLQVHDRTVLKHLDEVFERQFKVEFVFERFQVAKYLHGAFFVILGLLFYFLLMLDLELLNCAELILMLFLSQLSRKLNTFELIIHLLYLPLEPLLVALKPVHVL